MGKGISRGMRRSAGSAAPLMDRLESRCLLSSTLIINALPTDLVFDPAMDVLYVPTAHGQVQRYDLQSGTWLSPWSVGTWLGGADITPDGQWLYVTEQYADEGHGTVHKVQLSTGAVTDLHYPMTDPWEWGSFDIAIASNGQALVSGQISSGGLVPLRQIDLATGEVSVRTLVGTQGIYERSYIHRSADHRRLLVGDSSNFHLYDADADSFLNIDGHHEWSQMPAALNADGSRIAVQWGTVDIVDPLFKSTRLLDSIDGAIAFSPDGGLFFGVNSQSDQIVAYETSHWQAVYQLDIGQDIEPVNPEWTTEIGHRHMVISDDGRTLFYSTATGVRKFDLPSLDSVVSLRIDFPRFLPVNSKVKFTVSAIGGDGEPLEGFTGTVRLKSDDPAVQLPRTYTFTAADRGSRTLSATFGTAGQWTVSASASGGLSASAGSIRVHEGGVTSLPLRGTRSAIYDSLRGLMYFSTTRGTIERYDPKTETLLTPLEGFGLSLGAMDISNDGSSLYVMENRPGIATNLIYKIDLATGGVTTFTYELNDPHEQDSNGLAFVSQSQVFFFGGQNAVAQRLNPQTGEVSFVETSWGGFLAPFDAAGVFRSTDRSTVLWLSYSSWPGTLRLHDAASGELGQYTAKSNLKDIAAVSPDGSRMAVLDSQRLRIFDRNLRLRKSLPIQTATGMAFSRDGNVLFVIDSQSDQLWTYDATTWRFLGQRGVRLGFSYGTPNLALTDGGDHAFYYSLNTVRVVSLPISVDAGGTYRVREEGRVRLKGSAAAFGREIIRYEWDLDYDGVRFDVDDSGRRSVFSAAGLDGPSRRVVALRVTDSAGRTAIATSTVRVKNVAPVLRIDGPARVVAGEPYVLNLAAREPGNDRIRHWTIDWGDGTIEKVAGNPRRVVHVYQNAGIEYTVKATATDEDGTYRSNSLGAAELSESFGRRGRLRYGADYWTGEVAEQTDGKILVLHNKGSRIFVRRLKASGAVDRSFGDRGVAKIGLPGISLYGRKIRVTPDGKVLVLGTYDTDDTLRGIAILRLNQDGTLDPTFGQAGVAAPSLGRSFAGRDFAVDHRGRVVVAGGAGPDDNDENHDFAVLRLKSNGALDRSFSSDGIAITTFSATTQDIAARVRLLDDGDIVVGGYIGGDSEHWRWALARFRDNGAPERSFGAQGRASFSIPGRLDRIVDFVIQADGKIVAFGDAFQPPDGKGLVVARLNTDGTPDDSFGVKGFVRLDLNSDEFAWSIAIGPGGSIVLLANGMSRGPLLVRLGPDGNLSRGFGRSGVLAIGSPLHPQSMLLLEDGDLLLYSHRGLERFERPFGVLVVDAPSGGD